MLLRDGSAVVAGLSVARNLPRTGVNGKGSLLFGSRVSRIDVAQGSQ